MRFCIITVTCLIASPITAQTILDETNAILSNDDREIIGKAIYGNFKHPETVLMKNLLPARKGFVCGLVNAKNDLGEYVGFRLFAANHEAFIQLPSPANLSPKAARSAKELGLELAKICKAR